MDNHKHISDAKCDICFWGTNANQSCGTMHAQPCLVQVQITSALLSSVCPGKGTHNPHAAVLLSLALFWACFVIPSPCTQTFQNILYIVIWQEDLRYIVFCLTPFSFLTVHWLWRTSNQYCLLFIDVYEILQRIILYEVVSWNMWSIIQGCIIPGGQLNINEFTQTQPCWISVVFVKASPLVKAQTYPPVNNKT